MATKNLVPRADNEGQIGIPSRKWKQANFKTGFFDKTQTNELKNIADANLLVQGNNITIVYDNNQYTISSSGGGGGGATELNSLSDVVNNAPASGHMLVYNGTDSFDNVLMSGDITMASGGVTTISAGAVDFAMIADAAVVIESEGIDNNDNDTMLPTSAAVKDYVDSQVSSTTFDIASLTVHSTNLAATDFFAISTNSANKKVTIPALSKFVYSAVSGDATINSTGSLTLSNSTTTRTNLGLAIGTDVQEYDAKLTSIAGLSPADGNIIVGDGANFVAESGDTARSSLGLGTGNSPTFVSLTLSGQAAPLDLSNQKITSLGTPEVASDAATKGYTDSVASGLAPLASVKAATTAELDATYNASGTLTSNSSVAFTTDSSVSFVVNDRVLVKDQPSGGTPSRKIENGIYKITTLGDGSTPWVLTRTADFAVGLDTTAGSFIFVEEGDTNKKQGFVCISPETSDTVGTHDIIWSTFSKAGEYTAGSGLTLSSGTAFTLALDKLEAMSVPVDKDNLLAIYDDTGVTESKSVGDVLSDMTDNTTIEVDSSSKQLKIKDAGVSFAKIRQITNYKVLGHIDTDVSASAVAPTSEIQVDKSTDDNSEWDSPEDTTIPTQLSVSKLVENSSSGVSNPISNSLTFTVTSEETDSDSAVITSNAQGDAFIYLNGHISTYLNKTIHIYLKGHTWTSSSKLTISMPRCTTPDSLLESALSYQLNYSKPQIAFMLDGSSAKLEASSGQAKPDCFIRPNSNDPNNVDITNQQYDDRKTQFSKPEVVLMYIQNLTRGQPYNVSARLRETIPKFTQESQGPELITLELRNNDQDLFLVHWQDVSSG